MDNQTRAGLPRAFLAALINTSTEYRQSVVLDLYEAFLGRPADPGGFDQFVSFLEAGARNEDVMAALLSSGEYFVNWGGGNNEDFLFSLYFDLLGRGPDPTGFNGFRTLLNAGAPRSVIAYALLNSNEFRSRLVGSFYEQLLHRTADAGGRNFYVSMLGAGVPDEIVIDYLVGSDEYFNRAQGSLVPATVNASSSRARPTDPVRRPHPRLALVPARK